MRLLVGASTVVEQIPLSRMQFVATRQIVGVVGGHLVVAHDIVAQQPVVDVHVLDDGREPLKLCAGRLWMQSAIDRPLIVARRSIVRTRR